jgi:hypothetical protein
LKDRIYSKNHDEGSLSRAICRKCTMFSPYVVKGEGYRLHRELEKRKERD